MISFAKFRFLVGAIVLMGFSSLTALAQQGPHVLVVIAHPDDESAIAVTLYKIAKEQHGVVDLFVITNGEAGYKYSTLAEQYYHVELTEEKVGRHNLPDIRKRELRNAGNILGVSQYHFGDQRDSHFTLNEREPLDTSWNVPLIKKKLNQVLQKNRYDYVFCLLPEPETHGAHKAASLTALDAVNALPVDSRPIILGAAIADKSEAALKFNQYKNYVLSKTLTDTPLVKVDRTASFGYNNKLNYKVIANWEIAEHKSQGATQMHLNYGDYEEFWYFAQNPAGGVEKCKAFFDQLNKVPYQAKVY